MTIEELGAAVEQWEKTVEGYRMTNVAGKSALERAELQADLYAAEAQLESFRRSLWEAVFTARQMNQWLATAR